MPAPTAPRISLVIPNYWDGTTVLETLQSVQEAEEIEVVVVDDASPDRSTAEILRGYQRDGLIDTLILSETNAGVSRTVNIGVDAARGRYVCLFGNDDLLVPGALGRLADALDDDPAAGFSVGDFEYFGARPGLRRSMPWDPWRALTRNAWPGSMMVRRDVLLELGGLTDECIASDWDFYIGAAAHGYRGVVLPEVVYRYRIHEHAGRLSTAARRGYRDEARTVRRRHAALFARERELRRASDATWSEKVFWTLMLRLAPHRPPFLTDLFFHGTTMLARIRTLLGRGSAAA